MAKKQFFLIIDTETTKSNKVFDFAAIVVDRKGEIHSQCAIIVKEFIEEELFWESSNEFWSRNAAIEKKAKYNEMLTNGQRMIASSNAINRWLEKVNTKYAPMLTAYNLNFDFGKCQNSGIDLTIFSEKFCLWHTAVNMFCNTKNYLAFAMQNHYFGNKTESGNIVMQTKAEVMAHFITGNNELEPHTALEDAIYFELPILKAIVNKKNWKEKTEKAFNWRNWIMRDLYKPV